MKLNKLTYLSTVILLSSSLVSCEDFLDKEPPSYVVPEDYYSAEDQIQAVANKFYPDVLPSHGNWSYGTFGTDNNTDNQAGFTADNKYATGQWKVALENGNWAWTNIRNINYSLNTIVENYEAGKITGSDTNIRQYIGEIYFFRAYCYFDMLQKWGDLPIIKEALPDDNDILVEANKRSPRNEVARFILEDLDNAISYMTDNFDSRKNRLSPDVAKVLKSRVALFEASWLRYFNNTPFVPNGEGWPGKAKDYNANYQFPSGSIENEIEYFYTIAAESAEEVAEKYKGRLTQNTGLVPQSESDPENPYFSMFGNTDMSGFPDVLLWREYNEGLGITNNIEVAVQKGNYGVGLTRSMVQGFVMSDGKPIYANHDGFAFNDKTLTNVRQNADPRLFIFLKEPDQINMFKNMDSQKDHGMEIEPYPNILGSDAENDYGTGYSIRKGGTFDKALTGNGAGYTGSITFRATEALLNYMEAEYELTKSISSGKILEYWKIIRTTAGFTGAAIDPQTTIAATDITQEKLDWGSYSAGEQLTDPVLYNIRRERRCELMAEGFRWMDLIRWRALDQMIDEPYFIEGFHLWNTPMQNWYDANNLISDGSASATVSSPSLSEYYRPYQKNMTSGNLFKDGYTWHMAHYLQPLPIKQFQLTASDNASPELSPLYQNPYWPTTADMPAEK
ncbi:RagB/SusD family nutrient uptake outer membrane protein [Bacteroides sp. AN502]|nr:RagB/SusD family nutrient uptake outer membrane protein [Caecibacteroides pullorum]MDC6281200.1 RagB/SusD family nutrient uptake outer membrane protein [Caecibacteroides pullorum]